MDCRGGIRPAAVRRVDPDPDPRPGRPLERHRAGGRPPPARLVHRDLAGALLEPRDDRGIRHRPHGPAEARAAEERLRCVRDTARASTLARLPLPVRPRLFLSRCAVRILYLADIRFPLERANGIQSMETCHALASRGHDVTLVVRPDTTAPQRDPFEFYGLPRIPSLHVEIAPVSGPAAARRAGYLTFSIGRSIGRTRQDILFTRDLGLASLLLNVPAAMRAPLVYEA